MSKTPRKLPPGIRLMSGGRYQARYPVTENGVIRQVSAGTFASLADAKDARSRAIVAYQSGRGWVDPKHKKLTVEQWSKQWLELKRGANTKAKSFMRSRIVPYWGPWVMSTVTPQAVQTWVNSLQAEGLSPATVRALYGMFKQMLGRAVDFDLLAKNPCRTIELPAQVRKTLVPLPMEKILLLEQQAPERYRALIHLAAHGGLRWGELAALRWEDVDLETGVIHVCRGVKVDGTVGTTKNRKDRLVKMDPQGVEVLRAHRRDFGAREWVFTTPVRGVRLRYEDFRTGVWIPLTRKCGVSLTFHKLRHAHAGHMIWAGMDWKVLSDRLGHHAPSFTADMYGWRRPDADEVIVAAIEKAKNGG